MIAPQYAHEVIDSSPAACLDFGLQIVFKGGDAVQVGTRSNAAGNFARRRLCQDKFFKPRQTRN